MSIDKRSYSLSELLASVRKCIEASYTGMYWVRAETSGVNFNARSGHCYLELEDRGSEIGAKARVKANIWRQTFEDISKKFSLAGLQPLSSGMSVLCKVQLNFHELYGLSLTIVDIDPNYSLGEFARQKQETILRLKRDGVWDSNKGHVFPKLLQRIAIISSPTAAGYEDFLNQLNGNPYNIKYYTALFTAQMQGENTTESILSALDRISQYLELFDAVIIIRGGGAVSDLRAFDDYALCYYCTQFPLPIITGIGHDRDVSVLDLIVHTSVKTPTAVAELLIKQQRDTLLQLDSLQQRLTQAVYLHQSETEKALKEQSMRIPHLVLRRINRELDRQNILKSELTLKARASINVQRIRVQSGINMLAFSIRSYTSDKQANLNTQITRLKLPLHRYFEVHLTKVDTYEKFVKLADPKNILKKGFAIVQRDGQILNARNRLSQGDVITLFLQNQRVLAEIRTEIDQ